MSYKTLKCQNCHNSFVWSGEEQELYAKRGLETPDYCPICRGIIEARERDSARKNMSDDVKVVRTIGKYKIVVVQPKCIAAASCIAISPSLFRLNEENLAEMIEGGSDELDNIMLAAQSCPTGAIEIYEGEARAWPPQ
ncbi:MAG: zinc-ribbon domain containing protein [bacterium]